jgi:uncharacterized alkaline shock family protein YloU
MTEVAAGVPTPRSDADSTSTTTSFSASTGSSTGALDGGTVQSTEDGFSFRSAADRVGDVAGDTAQKVGTFASEAVDKAGDAVERAAAASGRIAAQVVDRLRNNAELAAERGSTTIANEVVEKIAGIATREVPGVYDIGGDVARLFAAVKERVGLGEADEENRGVTVRLEGSQAAIKIVIVIEYGFVVYSVTEKVRAKVISSIENLLGLEVTAVDILVDDVHYEENDKVGDDEARAATYTA